MVLQDLHCRHPFSLVLIQQHERTGTFIKVPQETQETHEHKTEHVKGETPIQIEVTKVTMSFTQAANAPESGVASPVHS